MPNPAPNPSITADELIATLQRSSLKTVLVEGTDDPAVYRRLERTLGSLQASFLECGGRINLLAVYERRSEFPNLPVCFVADLDMWVFSGVPATYSEVVFTTGYSIENDVYHDADIEGLLNENEVSNHQRIIAELARWFAFQVEEFLGGRPHKTDPNLHTLIPRPGFVCSAVELANQGHRDAAATLETAIKVDYKMKFRGKLLFDVLVRFFHTPGRHPKHSYDSVIDYAVLKSANGPLTDRIIASIRQKLNLPANSPN